VTWVAEKDVTAMNAIDVRSNVGLASAVAGATACGMALLLFGCRMVSRVAAERLAISSRRVGLSIVNDGWHAPLSLLSRIARGGVGSRIISRVFGGVAASASYHLLRRSDDGRRTPSRLCWWATQRQERRCKKATGWNGEMFMECNDSNNEGKNVMANGAA